MLKRYLLPLLLLACAIDFTAPAAIAAPTTATSSKNKKKMTAKERREAAKAKREAEKAAKEAKKAKKKAQQHADAIRAKFEAAEATTAVGKALKSMTYVGANRPDVTAEFYVVVRSSSTCPHCVRLLPEVEQAYTEMRATGKVELLYESFDNTAEQAETHLNQSGAAFPALMRAELSKLPGAAPLMIPPPAAYVVDANGKRLASGPLQPILQDWRKLTVEQGQN